MDKKKKDKKSSKERRLEETKKIEEELEELIDNLDTVLGENAVKLRVPKLNKKQLKKISIYNKVEIFLSLLILVALSGFFSWFQYEKVFIIPISFVAIVAIDYLIMFFIDRYMVRLILFSLGLIKLVPSIISFLAVGLFMPYIKFNNFWLVSLVFVLYNAIRKIIKTFVTQEIFDNKEG